MKRAGTVKDILSGILAIILFMTIPPFYLWKLNVLSFLPLLGYVIIFFLLGRQSKGSVVFSLGLIGLFYLSSALHQYGSTSVAARLFTFLPFLVFLINRHYAIRIFRIFLLLYTVFIIPSIIVYVLVYILGIDLPYNIIEPYNEVKEYSYYAYPFMVSDGTFRFHAYFDEPGVVGTLNAILLIANNCNYRDWKSWVLLLGGIFSCSKFFILLIILYVFIFGKKTERIICISVIILLISISYNYIRDIWEDFVYVAFSINEDYRGNRNSEGFDFVYKQFLNSNNFWIGYGRSSCAKEFDPGGSSWKNILVDSGFLMFLTYIIGVSSFYLFKTNSLKKTAILLFLFVATIYQRPDVYGLISVFLILVPVYTIDYNK